MFGCRKETSWEPSLDDTLSDPIVQTIMNADHVDPRALELSLRATAEKWRGRRRQPANENRTETCGA
jgi:hypothetical protein